MINTKKVPDKIAPVLSALIDDLRRALGNDLVRVVLYGSYSRGDYSNESDVDLLILINSEETKEHKKIINDLAAKYLIDYGVLFSMIIKSKEFYNHWKDTMDLFINIEEEGLQLV